VLSSRFAPTDAERNSKLLGLMRDVPDEKRTARFRCAIAIAEPQRARSLTSGEPQRVPRLTKAESQPIPPLTKGGAGGVKTCEASVEGLIAREPRGTHGFGYDPVFYVPELGKHMAELTAEEKNAISHRGKALQKARALLAASF